MIGEKRLMILGAGHPQVQLIKAAKELGYRTIVASIPGIILIAVLMKYVLLIFKGRSIK